MKSNSARKAISKRRASGGIVDTIKTLVYAFFFALVVRTVAYEPFNIPSGSMMPTLLIGDYLFVSKYSYGYSRYSLPFGLPLFSGRIFFHPPERGDVVVFRVPTTNTEDFIKRVIGLPGDKIQMKQGQLYINDKKIPRKEINDYLYTSDNGSFIPMKQYIETLPNGVEHRIIIRDDDQNSPVNNTPEFKVPLGKYFMMGDNRDNSADSRVAFGCTEERPDCHVHYFVPAENLIGRAQFIFFSLEGSARPWEFWQWPFAIRYDRLFRGVD
jgi:signal peptidase I